MGFVLNRPIDTEVNELADVPVYYGGPVEVGQMLLTSLQVARKPFHGRLSRFCCSCC